MMRLDRFLAENGFGTRQEVKKIIRAGRVCLGNQIVNEPNQKIEEGKDRILVDSIEICYEQFHYLMLNKPNGFVCSAHEKGQESVLSLIQETYALDLFPIGRLDKDTVGLLLLTNDGKLSHQMLSPKNHVEKEYKVLLRENASEADINAFEKGIDIGDEKLTLPAQLKIMENSNEVIVILHEGRFHQIKRMFKARGNEVVGLERVRMKNVLLDDNLAPGEYRRLSEEEIRGLIEND